MLLAGSTAAAISTSANVKPVSHGALGKLAQFLLVLFVLQPLSVAVKRFWAVSRAAGLKGIILIRFSLNPPSLRRWEM